jgi:hypothetical protein
MFGNLSQSIGVFFTDPSFKVLGIKGPWGCGKTHFWNEIIQSSPLPEKFNGSFYTSIFGLKSIGDIKQGLLLNYRPNVKSQKKSFLPFFSPKSIIATGSLIKAIKVPYVGDLSGAYECWRDMAFQNAIICIDDIERSECNVSFSEVLGFVSNLTELRGCKVVIIYNDQKLDETKRKQIDEYREKVIDMEIAYNPPVEENLKIVWPEGCSDNISKFFIRLGIKNIRVMQKTRRALDFFNKIARESCPQLIDGFEVQVNCLSLLYYVYSNVVSLEEAVRKKAHQIFFSDKTSDDPKLALLKELNYWPQDYDGLVRDYLVNGYVDLPEYKAILDQCSKESLLRYKQEELRRIWSKYHSNFTVNGDVFASEMKAFLVENVTTLTLGDVISSAYFLKEVFPSINISNIVNSAVDDFLAKNKNVDLNSLSFYGINTEAVELIRQKLGYKERSCSLHQLLNKVAGGDSWHSEDVERIRIFSQVEWINFLKTCEECDVISLLTEFLKRFGSQNESVSEFAEKIGGALNEIGKESLFNKKRIERFAGLLPSLKQSIEKSVDVSMSPHD